MKLSLSYAVLVLISCLCVWTGNACAQQSITLDWETKQLTNPPITVNKVTAVQVTVTNINNLLYSYHGRLASTGPAAPFPTNLPAAAPLATDACTALTAQLNSLDTAFSKKELSPLQADSTIPHSVPLSATIAAYNAARTIIEALNTICADAALAAKRQMYQNIEKQWDVLLNTPHTFSFAGSLEPTTNYSIIVTEEYNGSTTDACTTQMGGKKTATDCVIAYTPSSTIITQSEGVLATTMPGRSYGRGTDPSSGKSILTVDNSGPAQIALAALVNVQIPGCDSDSVGCTFSFGPVYQVASNGGAGSRLGLFTGFSLHLWHYLYLTPGAHIAQFADFPPGFSQAGQPIPSSFTGNLTPITKTGIKFAFAITIKGWDILKSGQSQGSVGPK